MKENKQKKKRGFLRFCLIFAGIFLLIRLALYDGIVLRRYTVKTDAVSRDHRYVMISDLHSTVYGENQEQLAERILAQQPEAVLFCGDIADDVRGFDGCAMLLERLKETAPEIPLYAVLGNHERWVEWTDDIVGVFEDAGVSVIHDEMLELGDGIRLFGVGDPLFYEDTLSYMGALTVYPTDGRNFDILLAHRPEFAETYMQAGYELALAGHAHGGQVRIPLFLNGLYAPNQGWFPERAGGIYEFETGKMIVSRGLMVDDLPRVFNPPEIVVIDVVKE